MCLWLLLAIIETAEWVVLVLFHTYKLQDYKFVGVITYKLVIATASTQPTRLKTPKTYIFFFLN